MTDMTKITSRTQLLATIADFGFKVVPDRLIPANGSPADAILAIKAEMVLDRLAYKYDIDGLVIAPDDLAYAKSVGTTPDRKTRNAEFAVKFDADAAISTIVEIEWSVEGRNYISPIAIVSPAIELSGAMINRVSLKSLEWAETYKVGIGTSVRIERSGDVIPYIPVDRKNGKPMAGSIVDNSRHDLNVPENCPCCGSKTTREGARLACEAVSCPAKVAADLVHFGATLGLKGIGHGTALGWVEAGVSLGDFIDGVRDNWAAVEKKIGRNPDVSMGLWKNIKAQLV